jgi:glycosyltransferase involved in cell wall biosynthesis
MIDQRLRVLLLADSCNPDWPSLPIVGYKTAKALAEIADVTLVTQVRNQPNLGRDGVGRARVDYLDTEAVAAPLFKLARLLRRDPQKGWTIQMAMDYPAYLAFEFSAWRRYRQQLRSGAFDIVHRLTPMSPTIPSPLATWSPVPFVLGPLNGNLPWPSAFNEERTREREGLSRLRRVHKWMPYSRATYRNAAAILAAFDHTVADVPTSQRHKTLNFPEVGIDPDLFSRSQRVPRERVTVLYAGRLVPYKLPEVLIEAFARSSALRAHELVIVGDGPDRARLEAMVAGAGLGNCVRLLGQRPQREVGRLMREAEIFAFPSIRELGAGVVVEAMACGMACVAVDYGGPATLIGGGRGVLVPLGTRSQLIDGFQSELELLVREPGRVAALGNLAYDHAMAFYSWERKAAKIVEAYRWVLGRQSTRPEFWAGGP